MNGYRSPAIVHDWLTGMRGGEKVLEVLCEIFPSAPIYTLVHRPGSCSPVIEGRPIRTSALDSLPFAREKYQYYLPLFPILLRTLDLQGHDLVISSSHAVAKGVAVPPGARHICYCHTPMRYIWDQFDQYFGPGRSHPLTRAAMRLLRPSLQRWDRRTASGVDHFIANSSYVAGRIDRVYGRKAEVVYPPVDTGRFSVAENTGSYFLIVSALVPYKRIDIAIEAFNAMGERLVIVGTGSEERRLKSLAAGNNIEFAGWVPDDRIAGLYASCRALVFPGVEDFGIVPVEAMASGKPVIAFGQGGVTETVEDGVSGVIFGEQTSASLVDAVKRFRSRTFNPGVIRERAMRFDRARCKEHLISAIEGALARPAIVREVEGKSSL